MPGVKQNGLYTSPLPTKQITYQWRGLPIKTASVFLLSVLFTALNTNRLHSAELLMTPVEIGNTWHYKRVFTDENDDTLLNAKIIITVIEVGFEQTGEEFFLVRWIDTSYSGYSTNPSSVLDSVFRGTISKYGPFLFSTMSFRPFTSLEDTVYDYYANGSNKDHYQRRRSLVLWKSDTLRKIMDIRSVWNSYTSTHNESSVDLLENCGVIRSLKGDVPWASAKTRWDCFTLQSFNGIPINLIDVGPGVGVSPGLTGHKKSSPFLVNSQGYFIEIIFPPDISNSPFLYSPQGETVISLDGDSRANAAGSVLRVYDLFGRQVDQLKPRYGKTVWDTRSVSSGSYIISLEGKGNFRCQKLITVP